MELEAPIYVAGHRGLVGSAILRKLKRKGFKNNDFGTLDHYLFFTDQAASLFAYITVQDGYKGGSKPKSFYITSFDSALDEVTKGTCEAFY